MLTEDVLHSGAEAQSAREASNTTLKTVLVHIQNEASVEQRLETALSIARAASAHVTCLQVTPIEAYVAFDGFGGVFIMNEAMKAIDQGVVRLREQVEAELANEGVSWNYVQLTGQVTTEIVTHSALADLVVTGREPRENELGKPSISFLGDLVQRSPTPLFIPGSDLMDPTGPALIAWNGSFEAANAVRSSLGLLKLASSVHVLYVTTTAEKKDAFPGTRLLEYLSRQGIHAEMAVESSPAASKDEFVASALISRAQSLGGAYVVMGGYGRSRIREFVFGGVTRTMLAAAGVPVMIAR